MWFSIKRIKDMEKDNRTIKMGNVNLKEITKTD